VRKPELVPIDRAELGMKVDKATGAGSVSAGESQEGRSKLQFILQSGICKLPY